MYGLVSSEVINGLRLAQIAYSGANDVPYLGGAYPVIYLVITGIYRIRANGILYTCRAGQLLVIKDGTNLPVEETEEGLLLFCFELTPAWCEQAKLQFPVTGCMVFDCNTLLYKLTERLQSLFESEKEFTPAVVNTFVSIIVMELQREAEKKVTAQHNWTTQLISKFAQNPDCLLQPAKLARELHISEDKLARNVKRILGITLTGYYTKKRLNKAYELLCNSGLSVSEISDDCGFAHDSHFINAFKKQYGMAPDQYRKLRVMIG